MSSSSPLRQETDAVFRRFVAAQALRPEARFHFLPIKDYAFGWILHPGFDDGTRMSGLLILSELEQAGLIGFEDDGFPTRQTSFRITEAGESYGTRASVIEGQAAGVQKAGDDNVAHDA